MDFEKMAKDNTIWRIISGSQAYGISTPESDTDIRGLFIAPREVVLSPFYHVEQWMSTTNDEQIYELKKFFQLLVTNNPNIIEILFVPEDCILFQAPMMKWLLQSRDLFLSKKIRHTFAGYAFSQLHRLKGHKKWIMNPQPEKPPALRNYIRLVDNGGFEIKDRGTLQQLFAECIASKVNEHNYKLWRYKLSDKKPGFFLDDAQTEAMYTDLRLEDLCKSDGIGPQYVGFAQIDIENYKADMKRWHDYWEWRKGRNEKRAALEAKSGYDCYHADTEFLTKSGWRKYPEVTAEDELATVYVNPEGKDLTQRKHLTVEYQRYTDKFKGTFTGEMYRFRGNHIEVVVTPNHKMLMQRRERKSNKLFGFELVEAAHTPDTFDFLACVRPKEKTFGTCHVFEDLPISDTTYLSLMGWYLSDGCMIMKGAEPKEIRISQKKGGKLSRHMAKFHVQHKEIGCSLYAYRRGINSYRSEEMVEQVLSIRNKTLVSRMFDDCGRLSAHKRIPRYVFSLSRRLMELLFDGMARGDGTVRNTSLETIIYYTINKGLADDVQELALLCGWETSLCGPYAPDNMYQVHVNKNRPQLHTLIRSAVVSKIPVEDQEIVCFTVPNGTLITRYNGHIGIHGNSKHAMHLVRLLKMAKEILNGEGVKVRRPDRDELLAIRNGEWAYEQVIEFAEKTEKDLDVLYETSSLPHSVDIEFANNLYIEMVTKYWGFQEDKAIMRLIGDDDSERQSQ